MNYESRIRGVQVSQNSGEKVSVVRDHREGGWRIPVFRVNR